MRWVNETLPPRERFRFELITMRLSMSSFAGMLRTLVATGMLRLASMLVASDFAGPRRGVTLSCSAASASALRAQPTAWAGMGCGEASFEVVRATGAVDGAVAMGVVAGVAAAGAAGVELAGA